jgi:UDP-glucuronate 4-epimerase
MARPATSRDSHLMHESDFAHACPSFSFLPLRPHVCRQVGRQPCAPSRSVVSPSARIPNFTLCQTQRMRMVVTGAAGFVGFHMARRLSDDGHDVLAIDSFEDNYSVELKLARWRGLRQTSANGFEVSQQNIDLCDVAQFSDAFASFAPDVILHFAARPGVRESCSAWPKYARCNLTALSSVLAAVCEAPSAPKLIYASSSSVYGGSRGRESREQDPLNPVSFYGATKVAGEQLVDLASRAHGFVAVGLRMFTVYGPWGRPDMLPWRLIRAALSGQVLPLYGDGNARRDFTFIDDVVESVIQIVEYAGDMHGGTHQLVNIGGGQSISVREAIEEVEAATGKTINVQQLPANDSDVAETLASVDKLQALTGFAPSVDFGVGIRMTVPWFESSFSQRRQHPWDS